MEDKGEKRRAKAWEREGRRRGGLKAWEREGSRRGGLTTRLNGPEHNSDANMGQGPRGGGGGGGAKAGERRPVTNQTHSSYPTPKSPPAKADS